MPFSISGRIAQGANEALEEVLERRLKEATRQQIERQNVAENLMRQQGIDIQRETLAGAKEDRAADNARQQQIVDLQLRKDTAAEAEKKTQANRASDIAGVLAMGGGSDMPGGGMKPEDQIREISGLAAKSGADPMKIIANLQPKVPKYTSPQRTASGELVQFEEGKIPAGTRFFQEPKTPQEAPIKLTPEGLDMAALTYRKTGQMPTLGMGDRGNRQNIMNRAASLTPDDIRRIESVADIAGNKQEFAANTASLTALQRQRDSVGAFEQTASKNIDVFLKQAEKIADSGSPLVNTPLRMISGSLLGNKDQAAYEAARQVAINEIAKITTSPTMAGQLSDTARKEVATFNPENATLGQTVAVMRILKAEMQNRITALDDQLVEIKSRGKAKPAEGTEKKLTAEELIKKYGG